MNRLIKRITAIMASVLLVTSFSLFIKPSIEPLSVANVNAASNTPLSVHGKLSVKGTNIVDKNGNKFQLRGLSSHGLAWDGNPYSGVGGSYLTTASFTTLRDDWGANAVRLALYVSEYGGYCMPTGNKSTLDAKVLSCVNNARDCGMYAIIDWHILNENPNNYLNDAKTFWANTSLKYKDYDNVLYEICNEPNNCSWDQIKAYANVIIPIIRANDPDAIIIVGTPTYSQLGAQGHTNEVADNPLTGYTNIMYALHFYCAEAVHTKYLPSKVDYAMSKGLPVIVSEFGLSEANGNGNISTSQADIWLKKLDSYNISYFCWALSHKAESASMFKTSSNATSNWTDADLTDAGKFIRGAYQARKEDFSAPVPTPTPIVITDPVIEPEDKAFAEAFVERLYVNMLGRHSDKAGRDSWVKALAANQINGDKLADGFYYSKEFTNISKSLSNADYVTRMYVTILGRHPDSVGLNDWVKLLNDGSLTREQVYKGFLGSQEWHNMCAENDIISGNYQICRFVERLYSVILNRKADNAGKAGWVSSITSGATAYSVAHGFVFSPEFTNKNVSNEEFVRVLYRTVLDRDPDAQGLNAWVGELNRGCSREQVFAGIVKSPEFVRLAAGYGMIAY